MQLCPCGSKLDYKNCCGPYIEGQSKAETAEKLLRSRYTAHVLVKVPYILSTVHPETRSEHDGASIEEWSKSTQWEKLEILESSKGSAEDQTGNIEFKAYYKNSNGEDFVHHEYAEFRKLNNEWFFFHSTYPGKTFTRTAPKIGRNDPCPCGSGKKYKKCCGA